MSGHLCYQFFSSALLVQCQSGAFDLFRMNEQRRMFQIIVILPIAFNSLSDFGVHCSHVNRVDGGSMLGFCLILEFMQMFHISFGVSIRYNVQCSTMVLF